MANVVLAAYYDRLTLQSDAARVNSTAVAAAASLGLITTETPQGFGRVWRATALGIDWAHGEAEL